MSTRVLAVKEDAGVRAADENITPRGVVKSRRTCIRQ